MAAQQFREVDLPRLQEARRAAAERRRREDEESKQRWRREWEEMRARFKTAPRSGPAPALGPVEARMARAGDSGGDSGPGPA